MISESTFTIWMQVSNISLGTASFSFDDVLSLQTADESTGNISVGLVVVIFWEMLQMMSKRRVETTVLHVTTLVFFKYCIILH